MKLEMSYDLFEREYADKISWQVEVLLGDAKEGSEDGRYSEDEYDTAYEWAIIIVAEAEDIKLV
jgi:hypothetical protein